MNREIWQRLFSLENRDITTDWFHKIHSRELSARRAKEINAAAKQAREYFRNASESAYSVRPLLTYYGIACLSRALLLLLKLSGGEEGLTASHGLETVDWAKIMGGDIAESLRNLSEIKIRTRAGLFSDFLTHTENRISMHISSARVDWRLLYDIPPSGDLISLDDLLSRFPDLQLDFENGTRVPFYSSVNELSFTREEGFRAKVHAKEFDRFKGYYEGVGYKVATTDGWSDISADVATFEKETPLFVHTYVQKMFQTIPSLYLARPFPSGARYSQLAMTFMVGYILGMIVRYYPTHWIALVQGEKGDNLWPTINRAQNLVEESFPELVVELIHDLLEHPMNDGS